MKHQERIEETESLRLVSQGKIVIGSRLKFQNLKIVKLRKNAASKRDERDDAVYDAYDQPESNDQGQTVQRKARGLSQMVVKAETKLHYGRPGTCSGQQVLGKATQQQIYGVR